MTEWVVLLRGINVGGHRKVPMADLPEHAGELGFAGVQTYIASGNLIGSLDAPAADVARLVEDGLLDRFGFEVDVVVRTAEQICAIAVKEVFPDAQSERPNLVHVVFSPEPPPSDVLSSLAPYLGENERACVVGDEIWIDFADGSGRSKVTPDVLKRANGQIVTSRNLRTIRKLATMTREVS